LFVCAGFIVRSAFISPYRSDREWVRDEVGNDDYHEAYVSAWLDVYESRDPKRLCRKARTGEILKFTGISTP